MNLRAPIRVIRQALRVVCLAGLLVGGVSAGSAQAPAAQVDPDLLAGRQLLARLGPEPQAHAAVISEIGDAKAQALLTAVMNHGQRPEATADDWVDMHRAVTALTDLFERKGELFRASIFAGLQDFAYRNYEHDFEAALAAARRSLDLAVRSGQAGGLHLNWGAVGTNLFSLGRVDEALTHFRTAQSLLPDPHARVAASITRDIVLAEIARGNLTAAGAEAARFLAAAGSAPPVFRARALMAQSDVLIARGQYQPAIDAVRGARDAARTDPAGDAVLWEAANQLMSVVLDAMRTLPYGEATGLAARIDSEFTDLPFAVAPFAKAAIRTRRRLAGELDAVLLEDNARLTSARAAGNVPLQIEVLRSLAATYRAANGLSQQIVLLEEALDLERSLMKPPGIPENAVAAYAFYSQLTTLGDAHLDHGQPGKAAARFNEASRGIEAMTGAAGQRNLATVYADAYLGQARVAELDGDQDGARLMLADALSGERQGPGRFNRPSVLLQLARLERTLGQDPARAASLYEEAVEAVRTARDRRFEVALRLEIARFLALADPGRLPDARQGAQRHLAAAERQAAALNVSDALWRVQYVAGVMAEAEGNARAAIDRYRAAVARLDGIRAGLSQQEQRQAFVDNEAVQDLYRRLLGLLGSTGRRDEAWEYLERGKARSFLEMLQGHRFRAAEAAPVVGRVRDLERQIVDLRVQLSPENAAVLRSAGRQPAAVEAQLRTLEQRFAVERQQADLGRTRAGQALSLAPPSLAELRKRIGPATALVEYGLVPGGLTVFIVTTGSVQQLTWPIDEPELKRQVMRLRGVLADARQAADLPRLLDQVSAAIVAPMAKGLPRGITHLLVVPVAYLHYLPFQVLALPGGVPLIDRYTIAYLPSASTLQFLARGPRRGTSDLFLGALGNVSVEGWSPLPGTLVETDAIARVFPGATRASGEAFTHDRAVAALQQRTQVHFATHGFVDEEAPLFSGLMTGPAEGQPTRLSLYEVPALTLRARLVVLSACETGLGRLLGGDEVAGLTRTFLMAGAETVVSSLWEVSDDATAILMEGFYRRLRGGTPPAEALRASALELRTQHPHPFYWAPFIVTGAR